MAALELSLCNAIYGYTLILQYEFLLLGIDGVFLHQTGTGTKQVYFGTRLLRAAQQHKERSHSTWGCDVICSGTDPRLTHMKTYYTSSVSRLEFSQSTMIWNMLSGSLQNNTNPRTQFANSSPLHGKHS